MPVRAGRDGRWWFRHLTGSVAELHARPVPALDGPEAWWCVHHDAAVVVGSGARDEDLDPQAVMRSGLAVVRRRSGGGSVLLVPGEVLWVDLLVPRGDPLWSEDVGAAAAWVGELWAACLSPLLPAGLAAPTVHRGPLIVTPWSRIVCFAGRGAGEVTLGRGGPKLVGVSQRRTREGARFQCAVPLRWDPAPLVGVARLDEVSRAEALAAVGSVAAGVAGLSGMTPAALTTALLDTLIARLP
jgi:lipoate---protein ligase